MKQLSGYEFQIGLTMSGAISAGAYTAGVIDFLVEALDAWEEARDGSDGDTVPNHRVGIKVMSGASAGAITAAIAAIALVDGGPDGKRKAPGAYVKDGFTYRCYLPKLYETWVVKPTFVAEDKKAIDFLSLSDLETSNTADSYAATSRVPPSGQPKNGAVISVLNTRLLDEIARAALKIDDLVKPPSPYVAEKLHIYLTLSNLRGVPYKVPFRTGDYHMLSHGDRVHYAVEGVGSWPASSEFADHDKQRPLSTADLLTPAGAAKWKDYAICALASSAFPIGLSARQIDTTLGVHGGRDDFDEYGERLFPEADLLKSRRIYPDWSPPASAGDLFWFTTADGGIIDNDPFEYAHFSLKDGKSPDDLAQRIPYDQSIVNRAVIMISPFPEAKPILPEGQPGLNIVNLVRSLMPALIDQARFKPSQLALALDEEHGSRYLVGPRRDGARYAIASGLLNGFGGFVARSFRDFDFQLGRRNCQRFLQTSFGVDGRNPIVEHWGPKVDREKFRAPSDNPGEPATYLLIPLYGSAAREVVLPKWPQITQGDFDALQRRIGQRFDSVAPALLRQNVRGLLGLLFQIALLPGLNLFLSLLRHKALNFVKLTILSDLVRRDQIAGWDLPVDMGLDPDDVRLVLAELLNPQFDLRTSAGIFHSIRSVAAPNLTPARVDAVLRRLKLAQGKPYQVWEAGWKDKTGEGEDGVSLYTLMSRKPSWADSLTGGRYLAPIFQPTVDIAGA
ncbi:MAG: hypothetical protein JO288_17880 [Hyphomicrobiales bacterium]|nr:hypothetical protein [Hyphomicrobiales bacterium]